MARHGQKQFFIRDNLVYRRRKVNLNPVEQLCLSQGRIETVQKLAHDMPASGHQEVHRIAMRFCFPGP
jgi:hypothetical protein